MLKKIYTVTIIMLVSLFAYSASAQPVKKPIEIISTNIEDIIELIKKPEFKTDETIKDTVFVKITNLFSWEDMGKRALGRIWNNQTKEQQHAFINAFTNLLRSTYFNQLEAYTTEKVTYENERIKEKYSEVQTFVIRADGTKTPVYYRLVITDNHWKIYDVVIEGVSMVKNYRTQFDEILKKNSFDAFIEKIQTKAQNVKDKKTE